MNMIEMLQKLNDDIANAANYKNAHLVNVLRYALDEKLKFILPEGTPPFREDGVPDGFGFSNLVQENRKFYIFNRKDLTPMKREGLFITMLESIEPSERELLILIKEQKLTNKYPNITKESVGVLIAN